MTDVANELIYDFLKDMQGRMKNVRDLAKGQLRIKKESKIS